MPSIPVDPLAPDNPLSLWPQQLELARRVRRAMATGERLVIDRVVDRTFANGGMVPGLEIKLLSDFTLHAPEILPPPILPEIEIPVAGAVKIRPTRVRRTPKPNKGKGGKR